ncbi:MFS transporter [Pseudonocardia yunnanensis]|uniref:MFS transporter n=1 Tax=Pseudonocardia yunnanensis TaxID=58107 RepID=A0ABW4F565_9PSEU
MTSQVAVPANARTGHRWVTLAVVLAGQFMASLDTTVGNVAAPDIGTELQVPTGTVQLAIVAYTLLYASLLITGARIGADRGRRRVFLTGVVVFTIASAAAGAAPSAAVLVGARAVQGIGAALMIPQIVSVIQISFTGSARARALSAYSAMISIGGAVGLAAGGGLIDLDLLGLGWRSVFLVNVPIGVGLFVVAALVLPRVPVVERRLDVPGVVLLTCGGVLVISALTLGTESGWPPWSIAAAAVGIAVLAVFVVHQRRTSSRGRPVLVDPVLFTTRGVRPGLLGLLLVGTPYTGILFCVAADLQVRHGSTAGVAGDALLPLAVGFGIGGVIPSLVRPGRQRELLIGGVVLAGAALLLLAWLTRGERWPVAAAAVVLGVCGLGFGMAFSPLFALTVAHVRPVNIPDASGMATTVIQFSFVAGVAVFGTVYQSTGHIATAFVVMAVVMLVAPVLARLHTLREAGSPE